ncbi:hypothetical protein ACLB1T_06435 [Escherichia coli]
MEEIIKEDKASKTISPSYEFFNIVLSLALLMNKKFKYKKSLLAAILSATLLAGCDGGGSRSPPIRRL